MSPEQLTEMFRYSVKGREIGVIYSLFRIWWPPGIPNKATTEKIDKFAADLGCSVRYDNTKQKVFFTKL